MEDETTLSEPLNPYAQAFFWLWGLIFLLLVGFKANGPAYGEQSGAQRYRMDVQTGERNQVGEEPNQVIGFLTGKTTARPGTFTSLASEPLPSAQYQLSIAARVIK